MERSILVLGGAGLLGKPVARRLRADGFNVRILTRSPKKASEDFNGSLDIITGDATDSKNLRAALEGCWGVHVSVAVSAELATAEKVAALASDLGVSRIGYVSGSTVDEANRWFPMIDQKLRAEQAVERSNLAWTVFRPTWPFETLGRFVRDGRATVIGRHRRPYHWFSADDFARMVSAAYQTDETAGKRLYIHGPEAILMHDALDRYRRTLYPEIESVATLPTWLGKTLAFVTRNKILKSACELMAYFDKVPELGDPTEANRLLGAPTTTLDAWLVDQRARRGARAALSS
jgi:NADH dehydrogenase